MTLLELAKQYQTDVQQRLDILFQDEAELLYGYEVEATDSELLDIRDQIKHWWATLNQITEVIRETEKN